MIRCPHCGRHHLAEETSCPFCHRGGALGRAARRAVAVASTMVLMACYGPGTYIPDSDNDTGVADEDGDGYTVIEDCDDTDPAINPGVTEVCTDGVDNDCDGLIDADDAYDCPTD
jgi:hypothetical protein